MTTEQWEVLHVRMSKDLCKLLDHWAVEEGMTRQRAVETLVAEALDARKFHWPPQSPTR